MFRPNRRRRMLRSYLHSHVIRFIIAAVLLAVIVGVILAATGTTTPLADYLQQRPTEAVAAFWAVVGLGIGSAFTATAVGVLHSMNAAGRADD